MRGMRKFIRARSGGRLLALGVASSLCPIQALLAVSVGCPPPRPPKRTTSSVVLRRDSGTHVPGPDGGAQNPIPSRVPILFVATQSAGQLATVGEAPAHPAYAGLRIAGLFTRDVADEPLVPAFFTVTVRDPRSPQRLPSDALNWLLSCGVVTHALMENIMRFFLHITCRPRNADCRRLCPPSPKEPDPPSLLSNPMHGPRLPVLKPAPPI